MFSRTSALRLWSSFCTDLCLSLLHGHYICTYPHLSSALSHSHQTKPAKLTLTSYVNVTNQPITNAGLVCDNQINIYNTTLSTGPNAPVGITGSVKIQAPYLPTDSVFKGVFGVKVDVAFVEFAGMACADLKGYHGTGSGDR